MCGLTFIYSPDKEGAALDGMTRTALDSMRHRGPDGDGVWSGENVSIGHVRLSIIDLHGSEQPMTDPSGRYVLTYNGEIYNYQELRDELKSHWDFRTRGDTEVLLAGLVLFGVAFLEKLDGMWGFVLWDHREKELVASRDRMGKKPLYYYETARDIACASELPVLSRLTRDHWEEDLDSTADYLRYGVFLPGTTAYKDVHEVLPGHVMKWSPHRSSIQEPYWKIETGGYAGSIEDASNELREELIGSIRRRMVADVEVGSFLSGGVDSSLITSIMAKKLGITPKAFTIGFREQAYDESRFAQQMARDVNAEHHLEYLEEWDRSLLVDIILNKIGQPFSDSSILPTYCVSRLAAKYVKVALSGDGGDELFCGYQRYQARSILRWYTRLPMGIRKNIKQLVARFPEPMSHHSRSLIKKAHLFIDVADRVQSETPYVSPVMYSDEVFKKLAPDISGKGHHSRYLPVETSDDSLMDMMHSDALVYLPQDILVKVDRASMANSLETRAPFLAKNVVELAFSLNRTWHRKYFSGKKMLKRSCGDLLPRSIWGRRKQGFGVPIHQWFREDLGKEMMGLLMETRNFPMDKQMVVDMFDLHKNRVRDHGYRLWNIYIYLVWRSHR